MNVILYCIFLLRKHTQSTTKELGSCKNLYMLIGRSQIFPTLYLIVHGSLMLTQSFDISIYPHLLMMTFILHLFRFYIMILPPPSLLCNNQPLLQFNNNHQCHLNIIKHPLQLNFNHLHLQYHNINLHFHHISLNKHHTHLNNNHPLHHNDNNIE